MCWLVLFYIKLSISKCILWKRKDSILKIRVILVEKDDRKNHHSAILEYDWTIPCIYTWKKENRQKCLKTQIICMIFELSFIVDCPSWLTNFPWSSEPAREYLRKVLFFQEIFMESTYIVSVRVNFLSTHFSLSQINCLFMRWKYWMMSASKHCSTLCPTYNFLKDGKYIIK